MNSAGTLLPPWCYCYSESNMQLDKLLVFKSSCYNKLVPSCTQREQRAGCRRILLGLPFNLPSLALHCPLSCWHSGGFAILQAVDWGPPMYLVNCNNFIFECLDIVLCPGDPGWFPKRVTNKVTKKKNHNESAVSWVLCTWPPSSLCTVCSGVLSLPWSLCALAGIPKIPFRSIKGLEDRSISACLAC